MRLILTCVLALACQGTNAQDLCQVVAGAALIAQDQQNTYLGRISNPYDGESIFNEYGSYGSKYSSTSIWNPYGTFGSEYNTYSATNPYTSTPPMIVKDRKVLGYLSANKSLGNVVSPNLLKALCAE